VEEKQVERERGPLNRIPLLHSWEISFQFPSSFEIYSKEQIIANQKEYLSDVNK
jgi:hypothetical protein